MGVEIEKKYTVKCLPENLEKYPFHIIEQGYLNVTPAIRVRRDDDHYYMTYKTKKNFLAKDFTDSGEIGQTENNMPLDKESYEHLLKKADGNLIMKKRYLIPLNDNAFSDDFLEGNPDAADGLVIELDVFDKPFENVIIAEVEFKDEESAAAYNPPEWFDEDVTGDVRYSNAHMSSERL